MKKYVFNEDFTSMEPSTCNDGGNYGYWSEAVENEDGTFLCVDRTTCCLIEDSEEYILDYLPNNAVEK